MPEEDAESRPGELPKEPSTSVRTIDSSELLQGAREVVIRHGDETYRLRVTRQDKLILHK